MKSSSQSLPITAQGQTPEPRTRNAFQIKGRSGWHAEYVYHDGKTQRRTFADKDLGNQWLDDQKKLDNETMGPLLGGPERVSLGQFLGEYAFRFSIAKQSYETEIARINHYVEAVGAPRLVVHRNGTGGRELRQESAPAELPKAFKAHRDARMAKRERTYATIAKLARTKVSKVSTSDIRELMTNGKSEGWTDSTIQKEVDHASPTPSASATSAVAHGYGTAQSVQVPGRLASPGDRMLVNTTSRRGEAIRAGGLAWAGRAVDNRVSS